MREQLPAGLDVVLTGDMGIANTTPSACLVCHFTGLDAAQVVGRGTGIDGARLARKVITVRRALEVNLESAADPLGGIVMSPVSIPVKLIVAMPETGGGVQGVNPDSTAFVTVFPPVEYNVAPV